MPDARLILEIATIRIYLQALEKLIEVDPAAGRQIQSQMTDSINQIADIIYPVDVGQGLSPSEAQWRRIAQRIIFERNTRK